MFFVCLLVVVVHLHRALCLVGWGLWVSGHLFHIVLVVYVAAVKHQALESKESEDMAAVVWAVDRLCHLVMKEMILVVEVVLVVVLLRQALPDQPRNHSVGNIPLLVEQVHGNRGIFWRCSVRRTGCLNRSLDRS